MTSMIRYVDCDVPHDPIEYPVSVSVGASLVGQTDEAKPVCGFPKTQQCRSKISLGLRFTGSLAQDLNAPDRPRSMLLKEQLQSSGAKQPAMRLKELVKTGAAMKTPLFFLDQRPGCTKVSAQSPWIVAS